MNHQPDKPVSDQNEESSARSSANSETESKLEFERLAAERPRGFLAEFVGFLWEEKRWWLMPIVLVLLVISLFIVVTNTAVGPFIYVLF